MSNIFKVLILFNILLAIIDVLAGYYFCAIISLLSSFLIRLCSYLEDD